MPRRREPLQPPREYVVRGDWPDGIMKADAPMSCFYLRAIVVKTRAIMADKGLSLNDLTLMTNLDRSTLRLVLNGYNWPDVVTIVKVEQALETNLWPDFYDFARATKPEQEHRG